ncbi:MAG TPA: hypothetical protein VNW54_09715 [Granulicella sp.]|jgi:hypothetical protein|nr:hypothetical protein [Granulicella sp.]
MSGPNKLLPLRSTPSRWILPSLLLPLALASAATTFAQSAPAQQPTSESTARLIGVLPEIDQLRQLSSHSDPADSADSATRWQILWLHQHVSEQVMAASLQVDATIAQIDNEISRANELRGYLSDRRDHTVSRANLLSILIGGGVGATSSGLQLSSDLTKPAAAVGIASGTLSASLALAGIRAQKGHTSPFEFNSNMLAQFFDRPPLPDSRYPATVWTFLNQDAPNAPAGTTRKQQLLQTWVQVQRIDSLSSIDKIDHVTSQPSQLLQLSIDDLEDRAAMLEDVRARISFLKRDLGNLLSSLPAVDVGTPPAEGISSSAH